MTDLTLFLVRHGETAWSLSGQHTGSTEIALTAYGEDQARRLAAYLARFQFTHVLISPRERARRTCELAGLGASAVVDRELREWDYGAYEGRRTADIKRERPGWNLWEDGCPDGETPADARARADRLIAHLDTLSGNVALFSHGHFGCALAVRWLGLAIGEGRHFVIDPGSLGVLGASTRDSNVRALLLWNASADLCSTTPT